MSWSDFFVFYREKYILIEALFKFWKGCYNIFENVWMFSKFDTPDICVVKIILHPIKQQNSML